MLATGTFTKILAQSGNGTTDIILNRRSGVLKQLNISKEMCSSGHYMTAFVCNPQTSTISMVPGTSIQAITDTVGVRGDCSVEVTFISDNIGIVSIIDGEIFMKNANDAAFGYNIDGVMAKHTDKIRWTPISELFGLISDYVVRRFNISATDAVDYIYNATFRLELSYEENSPFKARQTHCYSNFRFKVANMTGAVACGLFDFIVFEKEEEETEAPSIYDKFARAGGGRRRSRKKNTDADEEEYITRSDEEIFAQNEAQYEEECEDAFEEVEMDPNDFADDTLDYDFDEEYGADDTDGYYD